MLDQRKYAESYTALNQLAKLSPNYQDASSLLDRARSQLVQQHYNQGIRLYREEKLEPAIAEWRTVLTVRSKPRSGKEKYRTGGASAEGPAATAAKKVRYLVFLTMAHAPIYFPLFCSIAVTKDSTIAGSNCVPAPSLSRSSASAGGDRTAVGTVMGHSLIGVGNQDYPRK